MQFYTCLGERRQRFGYPEEDTFECTVGRTMYATPSVEVNFYFEKSPTDHHYGTLHVSVEEARWLAFALLRATDGEEGPSAVLRVKDGEIVSKGIEKE